MKYHTILLVLAVSIVQVACRSDPIPATLSWSSNPKRGIHATTDKNLNIDPLKQDSTRVTRPNQIRAGAQTRQITTKKAVALGMLLALNSGVVNGVCLSGLLHSTKQASAAVTGAWTNSALGAATGNTDQFAFNGKCILSYFFGSFLSGLVNPNPKAFEISVGSVRTAFLIGSALLCASSVMVEQPGREFIFLAAMANGIQNSLTSTTTANLVRSAHFSGITSDMGTFLGQAMRGNYQNVVKLKVFFSLALSFWTGGFASYSLTKNFGKQTLLFSSILYLILGLTVGFA